MVKGILNARLTHTFYTPPRHKLRNISRGWATLFLMRNTNLRKFGYIFRAPIPFTCSSVRDEDDPGIVVGDEGMEDEDEEPFVWEEPWWIPLLPPLVAWCGLPWAAPRDDEIDDEKPPLGFWNGWWWWWWCPFFRELGRRVWWLRGIVVITSCCCCCLSPRFPTSSLIDISFSRPSFPFPPVELITAGAAALDPGRLLLPTLLPAGERARMTELDDSRTRLRWWWWWWCPSLKEVAEALLFAPGDEEGGEESLTMMGSSSSSSLSPLLLERRRVLQTGSVSGPNDVCCSCSDWSVLIKAARSSSCAWARRKRTWNKPRVWVVLPIINEWGRLSPKSNKTICSSFCNFYKKVVQCCKTLRCMPIIANDASNLGVTAW